MNKIYNKLLKLEFPFLKHVKIDSNAGIYDIQGIDVHVFTVLYNILKNNDINLIFEIDRPNEFNLSLSNLFLDIIPSTSVIIVDQYKESVCLNKVHFADSAITFVEGFIETGLTPEHAENNRFISYTSFTNLLKTISNKKIQCTILAINFDFNLLKTIDKFISYTRIYSILIYNTKIYDKKINEIRNHLLTLGYVFYSRINNKHDLFILSDSINGFTSNLFFELENCTLTKWVSLPPDSDYTIPK
jgi:hypothetical protein